MPKLSVGERMPDFTYDTPFARNLSLSETVNQVTGKTAIVFLRYYGCTLCQLDLRSYAEAYDRIIESGGQFLVVLQSSAESLAAQMQQEELPYPIICDPEKKLYTMLSIDSASSALKMMSPSAVFKGIKAVAKGFKHGAYEGDELQLPAVFVMTQDLRLVYTHYGRDAGDAPTADKLASLLA